MRRWFIFISLLAVMVPACAITLRSDGTVTIPPGQIINDDLVVSGGTVTMSGTVLNDLVVAAGTANVDGQVRGDLIVAGGTVNVRQPVGGTIYVAGGTVNLSSLVGRNLVVAGGTVNGERTVRVGRDLVVSGGTVTMAGTVTRDLRGSIGTFTLTNTARVGRDLIVSARKAHIASGAIIGGQRVVTRTQQREHRGRGAGIVGWIIWRLIMGIGLYIVGAIFIALAPRMTAQAEGVLRVHPWASLLTGLILLIVVPFAAALIMFFIVTIPLSLILLALYAILLFLSPIFAALLIGHLILRRPTASPYLALLIGLVIITLLRLIPFLGGLVHFLAILFGLGALFLAWQARGSRPIYAVEKTE